MKVIFQNNSTVDLSFLFASPGPCRDPISKKMQEVTSDAVTTRRIYTIRYGKGEINVLHHQTKNDAIVE